MTEIEISRDLQVAMQQYAGTQREIDCDSLIIKHQEELDRLSRRADEIREKLQGLKEPYTGRLKELKDLIVKQVLELGQSASFAGVTAAHKKGYNRITWENKKLTALCMANPALLEILSPTRKVTPVAASVSVSFSTEVEIIPETETAEETGETPF